MKSSGNIQLHQDKIDQRRRQTGMADDVVDFGSRGAERVDDKRAIGFVRRKHRTASLALRLLGDRSCVAFDLQEWCQSFGNVIRRRDNHCAVFQRRVGGTEVIDEVAKGRRPDIVGADETQPRDALAFRQRNSLGLALRAPSYPFAPILLSVPLIRREMLVLCFQ